MSRTFRKRKKKIWSSDIKYILSDWVYDPELMFGYTIKLDPKSDEAKRRVAKFRSDAGTHNCREPGPSWYRRITRQIPLRRDGKEQLRKFMLNEEYEVMITENPPLEYWT